MRRTFILLTAAILLCLPATTSGKPRNDKEKKKVTLFAGPDRKSLLRERDSLRQANEALMLEPTETESKETMDEACAVFEQLYQDLNRPLDTIAMGNAESYADAEKLITSAAARGSSLPGKLCDL